jgi:hypothetical protein
MTAAMTNAVLFEQDLLIDGIRIKQYLRFVPILRQFIAQIIHQIGLSYIIIFISFLFYLHSSSTTPASKRYFNSDSLSAVIS